MVKNFSEILLALLPKQPNWDVELTKSIGYELFKEHINFDEEAYEEIYKKISVNTLKLEKFEDVVKFYYFWCKDPILFNVLLPEFKLVIVFSIMEELMSKKEYVSLDQWLESKFKAGCRVKCTDEYIKLREEYFSQFGTKQKVVAFLVRYFDEATIEEMRNSIRYFDKKSGDYLSLSNISEVIDLLVGLRNLFIHRATDIQISSIKDFQADAEGYTVFTAELLTIVNGRTYSIDKSKVHIEKIIGGFEKGLLKYFVS